VDHQQKGNLVGISNVGNSCFANSLIQCLYHTHEFKSKIYDFVRATVPKNENCSPVLFSIQKIFENMDKCVNDEKHKQYAPSIQSEMKILLSQISKRSSGRYKFGSFGDPNILLLQIVSIIVEDLNIEPTDPEFIFQPFLGQMKISSDCIDCTGDRDKNQGSPLALYEDLFPLDINRTSYTENHFHKLRLVRQGYQQCDICQKNTMHNITSTLEQTPSILVVNLDGKHEESANKNDYFYKILDQIKFRCAEGEAVYRFYAASLSQSLGDCGWHYVAIVKRLLEQKDVDLLDDSTIKNTKVTQVGYYPRLVFYRRVE